MKARSFASLAALFLVAAILVQFRQDILLSDLWKPFGGLSKEGRMAQRGNNRFFNKLDSSGGRTLEQALADSQARLRGEKTAEELLDLAAVEEEIANAKASDRPFALLLYGGAGLFLFGAMMKKRPAPPPSP